MLPLKRIGPVMKLGEGELGGKARALPFLDRLIRAAQLNEKYAPHQISVPETWVLATDCFSDFIEKNALQHCAGLRDDAAIKRQFLAAALPKPVCNAIKMYLETHQLPLAIRSSALSEDTHHHTTAGLYSTYFSPNTGVHRLNQVLDAIKLVYASVYFTDVERYIMAHSIPWEDERMAVALQTVVGSARGDAYYPLVSGVAQSINYFPVGPMSPADGVATIAFGLGRRIVSGADGLRFCPSYPSIRPDATPDQLLLARQTEFDAVKLDADLQHLSGDDKDTITSLQFKQLETSPHLSLVCSIWDADSGVFYDSLVHPGERVLTFSRLLKDNPIPLTSMLKDILKVVEDGFGMPIEIEFALDIERSPSAGAAPNFFGHLVLLQARPLPQEQSAAKITIPDLSPDDVLIRSNQALGHGSVDGMRYIVFVDPLTFSLQTSAELAKEVAALNDRLGREGQEYILLGPGRWGSCNKAVGVPVKFRQIDGARLIGEITTPKLALEPSQGTHFFHNVVAKSLFYLTIDIRDTRTNHTLNLPWLRAQPNAADTKMVKLIDCAAATSSGLLSLRVDGRNRTAVVYQSHQGAIVSLND